MSKTKLKKIIGNPPKDSVVLPASDAPNYYWHLEYLEDARFAWEVYIAVNQVEIIPSLFESKGATLFVGVEQGVFVINTNTGEIISQVTNTSYVQSIEPISSNNYVLVSSEVTKNGGVKINAVSVGTNGEKYFEHSQTISCVAALKKLAKKSK